MTLKFSTGVRNDELDAIEVSIGLSPKLNIYSSGSPANITDAPTGTLLVDMLLPADWLNAAAGGSKTINGSWSGSGLDAGTAGYFRIINSGSVAQIQGSVGMTGGTADMLLDNSNIALAQVVTISTFTLNAGNS